MKPSAAVLLLLTVGGCARTLSQHLSPHPLTSVAEAERLRLDAFRNNDRTAYLDLVSRDLVVVHSNGEISGLDDELAAMRPSTVDDPLPALMLDNLNEQRFGDAAVLRGDLVERSRGHVQFRLRFTNIYRLDKQRWKLVSSQLTKAPND